VATALLASGCYHPPEPGPIDSGVPDAGQVVKPPKPDAGIPPKPVDAGMIFPATTAAEPCPLETFGMLDLQDDGGVYVDPLEDGGSVQVGLCVALRKLTAGTKLNDMPASGPVSLRFEAGDYADEMTSTPDPFGRIDLRVMKGRYDILKYHPTGIFATHTGYEEFGNIDLSKDQQKQLAVRSQVIRGGISFATLPFISQAFPPDISFDAPGLPPMQNVTTSSNGGGYEVSLLEGTFALYLSTPPSALGGTELIRFPLSQGMTLNAPILFDINLKAHELEGTLRIDGKPIPDRRLGDDYQLEFTNSGELDPTVVTHHDGAVADFHSLVPEGKYSVNLHLESAPDKHLPSLVYNKQVAQFIDLTSTNQRLDVALTTNIVEGGILIDGQPVRAAAAYNYTMYWYSFSGQVDPWALSYYEIPLDTSTFSLNVFPGNYYVMLYIDSNFAPNLVEGWYTVNKYFQVQNNTVLPISIDTSLYSGIFTVDGQPPPAGQPVGEMQFRSREGGFYSKNIVCGEDGSFTVRVPKGAYDVSFYINRKTYPEYATGRQRMIPRLDLATDQVLNLNYETVLVTGPMRVAGEVVPDSSALEETGLVLLRRQDGREFTWGFNGGKQNYRMRIPFGDYAAKYRIEKDVWPDVAWGTAPLGISIPAHGEHVPNEQL
jgi:hypothetical protein